jgi:hypothetical protein
MPEEQTKIETVQPTQTTQQPAANSNKTLWIILAVVGVLVVLPILCAICAFSIILPASFGP